MIKFQILFVPHHKKHVACMCKSTLCMRPSCVHYLTYILIYFHTSASMEKVLHLKHFS